MYNFPAMWREADEGERTVGGREGRGHTPEGKWDGGGGRGGQCPEGKGGGLAESGLGWAKGGTNGTFVYA